MPQRCVAGGCSKTAKDGIIAERKDNSTSCEESVESSLESTAAEFLPRVQEATTQTQHKSIQITVPTKNQETQCTLLKEFFVTSKPSQSKDEESASEEEMDADDDPSYVPDPDDEMGEDKDFDDFDDCLYESWDSQPSIAEIPVGNMMMSSGILFGGGSPAKVLKIMRHMNVLTIGYSTFMNHQKKYLHPAVERTN
ncbi:hypothetical protein OS493_000704 [Desmophyllum pertusum]|uniref:Uncharacterized protein n=1 Tax=Desmophyllum pertusum TaxID=174260 RepID=A0A9X0ABB4_9CNID|nr:hypothetical protein OS493_000704 [Desmophyllum pertusum]